MPPGLYQLESVHSYREYVLRMYCVPDIMLGVRVTGTTVIELAPAGRIYTFRVERNKRLGTMCVYRKGNWSSGETQRKGPC